jgi:hypothetical protein
VAGLNPTVTGWDTHATWSSSMRPCHQSVIISKEEGRLADYRWVQSTKADVYRRLGRFPGALEASGKALK